MTNKTEVEIGIIAFKDRYASILKSYFECRDEQSLLMASDLGHDMVHVGIPPEEIAEIHEHALQGLAEAYPDTTLLNATQHISTPLMEMLMAYGLAFREYHRKREALIKSEAVIKSEESLRHAQRIAHVGNWDWNIEDNTEVWSDEQYRIFGYQAQEMTPNCQRFIDAVHPEDRKRVLAAVDASLHESRPYDIEFRIIRPDHSERHILAQGQVLMDASNKPLRMIGTVQDITERKQTEKTLQLAARVFDASQEGIMITDPDTKIIRVNQAFTTVTGYSRAEAIGKTPGLLHSGRQGKLFYQDMWQKLNENGLWQGEVCNRRKNGEDYIEWLTITVLRGPDGSVSHYIGVFFDITHQKRDAERIQYLAHFDSLTRLPNRTLFYDELKRRLSRTAGNHQCLTLLYLDFDHFKEINDQLGHAQGDHFLQKTAERIKTCIRPNDLLARLSGDEFCIIVSDLDDKTLAIQVVGQMTEKIKETLQAPMALEGGTVTQHVSIGIALYPQDSENLSDLVKYADLAMYEAKKQNGSSYAFFSKEMNRTLMHQLKLKNQLDSAFESKAFFLCYQAQISHEGRLTGFEALLRWQHPEQGILLPGAFMSVLETMDLIDDVGEWVLRAACTQAAKWQQQGLGNFKIAVNLSTRQLKEDRLPLLVAKVLHDSGLDGKYLELEVTESLMIKNPLQTAKLLQEITRQGVGIALDDFGTGYSSLSYLKRFPIQTIKIDQSFVRDVTTDADDAILVKTIINMAKNLGLNVVAEGVETEAQLAFLKKNGCQTLQGHYYAKPMPEEAVNEWLAEREGIHTKKTRS